MANENTELKKDLGLIHIFCITSGAMISSGLFVLPGLAYEKAGPAIIISYLIAGLLSLPGMLSLVEMTTAMPRAGADCYGVIRSMGPGIGTVAGLLSWFSLAMKSAFALIGLSLLAVTFVNVNIYVIAIAGCLIFLIINLVGVKEAGVLQLVLAGILFLIMIFYIIRGLPFVEVQRFEPFAAKGIVPVFSVAGYVFISYAGLLKLASMAEEIRNPAKNIPLGMLVTLSVVTIFYFLMIFVTVGVLDGKALSGSLTPISDGANAFMKLPGKILITIAAFTAFLTTANAGIMTSARSLVPLSRDKLFPEVFARIHSRFGTPHYALFLTGIFIIVSFFLRLEVLVEAASIVLILTNVLSCFAVIILRESGVQNYRPTFRTPLYPWMQIIGIIAFGFILLEMGGEAYIITIILSLAGFSAYWFYGRKKVRSESAMLHLMERITNRELVTGTLEEELRELSLERDEVTFDRFDKIIEKCPVLDLKEKISLDKLFRIAGKELAESVGVDSRYIYRALKEKEEESSTAITPDLAIPHILTDGEHKFEILLVRSKEGIEFSGSSPKVHAIFVLLGTRDERNFHLYALSAIAQVAGDPEFMNRWMKAHNEQGLRDVVILGKRLRPWGSEK
ncbi:amino acid permease [candidate division WOR-3 bacterium]|nr:amino acid permease [candidate division WOR-3 bacterium]